MACIFLLHAFKYVFPAALMDFQATFFFLPPVDFFFHTTWHLLVGLNPLCWRKVKSIEKSRQHIKQQRHHFADQSLGTQSYGFSNSHVQMWELYHKKAEGQRIDAFELWCWRRLLRVPWIARRANQSILKEINPEYSLEGLTLKLKL